MAEEDAGVEEGSGSPPPPYPEPDPDDDGWHSKLGYCKPSKTKVMIKAFKEKVAKGEVFSPKGKVAHALAPDSVFAESHLRESGVITYVPGEPPVPSGDKFYWWCFKGIHCTGPLGTGVRVVHAHLLGSG